jgi:hypothetical protein
MKNKSYCLTLLMLIGLVFASCSGSKGGSQRKGYGCPNTASLTITLAESNKA